MKLVIYGDFNCPYSCLASVRADALSANGITGIEWRAVEHDPGIPRPSEPAEGDVASMLDREVVELGGLLADVAVADQYEDKDTYLITTGDANELSIKLEWNSASNLDFIVFEAESAEPVKRANVTSNTGPEYEAFAVKPATAYWVLVGAKTGSTFPTAYSASVCGASFVP